MCSFFNSSRTVYHNSCPICVFLRPGRGSSLMLWWWLDLSPTTRFYSDNFAYMNGPEELNSGMGMTGKSVFS